MAVENQAQIQIAWRVGAFGRQTSYSLARADVAVYQESNIVRQDAIGYGRARREPKIILLSMQELTLQLYIVL
jgi:hypothetical protein